MQNTKEVITLLAGVYSFYRADLTEFHVRAWQRQLAGFDMEQIREAFDRHMGDPDSGQFLPKPADVHKHLQGTHGDRALIAWSKLHYAMERVGVYQSVQFDDGIIHAVVEDMGGWVHLGNTKTAELQFLQKRFCDSYRAYSRTRQNAFPRYLPGIAEASNAAAGQPIEGPVLIGDPEKAKEVGRLGGNGRRTQITLASEMARLTHEFEQR